jgi:hypothetical protein
MKEAEWGWVEIRLPSSLSLAGYPYPVLFAVVLAEEGMAGRKFEEES